VSRERWIRRAQARARGLRDAARASRSPALPPVEVDPDPDPEEASGAAPEPAEPPASQPEADPEPVVAEPGGQSSLWMDPEAPAQPLPQSDPEASPESDEPAAPEVHPRQERLHGPSGLRERIASLGYETRGVLSDVRHSAGDRWHSIPLIARQRVAAGAIVVAVVALIAFVLVPAAPCGFPGGDECAPPDDAIDLVPADALAYAHLDIDPESDQYADATALAARVPLLSRIVSAPLARAGGGTFDLATDVQPWAGEEAAVTLLPTGTSPSAVTIIEVDDPDGAEQFASGLLGPSPTTSDVAGVEVSTGARGESSAQLDGFLLLGDEEAVSQLVDPPDDAGKLETSEAGEAIDDLPEDRLAYAYLSGTGARAVLASRSLRPLDTFVDSAATAGVAASISVDGDSVSVTLRSHLDPDRAESAPGFFSALPTFEPTLASDVGADALAYLGVGSPADSVQSLLSQAATEAPALKRAYGQVAGSLRKSGKISIARDLLPLLGTQVALAVEPVAAAAPQTPGVVATPGVPYVSLLAEGIDSQKAAAALALLQRPLTEALVPKSGEVGGRVSAFEPLQIAGVEAQSLAVSANVELTYATYDDRLAVATDPLGIAQARAGGDGLAESEAFGRVTAGFPDEVSLIAYLDLRDLIALGEQIGLATDPGYATLAPDLRSLDAAAIAVSAEGETIRTDATLAIGEPPAEDVDSPPTPGE
jgi:hypothetical protein